jgi:hypothetical protein
MPGGTGRLARRDAPGTGWGLGIARLRDRGPFRLRISLVGHDPNDVISISDKLRRLQRVEDAELLAVAIVRTARDTGDRVSLDDAAARFGIDLDDVRKR